MRSGIPEVCRWEGGVGEEDPAVLAGDGVEAGGGRGEGNGPGHQGQVPALPRRVQHQGGDRGGGAAQGQGEGGGGGGEEAGGGGEGEGGRD